MFLLNKSFIPYFAMLEKWIYEGTIGIFILLFYLFTKDFIFILKDDIYKEFLINEN